MSYTKVIKTEGSLPSTEELPIYYDLYVPGVEPGTALPVVLFLHGFKGFKDWGAFPDACEEIARDGLAVIAFNLSLNGIGKEMTQFNEPHLFRRQTLSQDLADVGSVIEGIKNKKVISDQATLDSDKIGIIGHSRGGHTALAAAAEYPEIQCLVTWSSVSNYLNHWAEKVKKDWEETGTTQIKNSRTGQILPLDKVVYEDAVENEDRLMADKRVQELHIPCLFIAGREDEAVPVASSERLFRNCPSDDKEIRIIEQTGHTFGVSHPFEEEDYPKPFAVAMGRTRAWLGDHLK
ncbi:MAG: alpha/beta fold hydrolase [Bacteroidetes bacterium]|jgi:dienelactone hydrolase|nr:alpha/beta fold hydrolase [Bacteroidota bacterium]